MAEEKPEFIEVYDLETNEMGRLPLGQAEPIPNPKIGVAIRPQRVRVSTSLVRDKATGKIYLDAFKRFAKPYWLTTEPKIVVIDASQKAVVPIPMPIDRQGPVEIDYSFFQSTGDFLFIIQDPAGRPLLMNREIHIRTIASGFGSGGLAAPAGRPFIWPEPWFFNTEEKMRNFMVGFVDLSGAPNNIRLAFHGRRFYHQNSPPGVVKRYEQYYNQRPVSAPYFYTTLELVKIPKGTPVGTVLDFHIRITDDADAVFYKFTSVQPNPYEYKFIEASQGRSLMSDFIRVENAMGDGELPHILFEPTYFEAGTKLIFQVRNLVLDEDDDQIIFPTFTCSKIFRRPLVTGTTTQT